MGTDLWIKTAHQFESPLERVTKQLVTCIKRLRWPGHLNGITFSVDIVANENS